MSLPALNADICGYIFKDLSVYNIMDCMRVSKKWNHFLKSDAIWKYFTEHYQVNVDSGKFKAIHEEILNKERTLRKRCSKEFLLACSILFGKSAFLHRLPVIEIKYEETIYKNEHSYWYSCRTIYRCFPEKCFSHRVAIAFIKNCPHSTTSLCFLLCSFRNKEKKQVQVAFSFGLNSHDELTLNLFYNSPEKKENYEQLSGFKLLNSKPKFARLLDIIEGKYPDLT